MTYQEFFSRYSYDRRSDKVSEGRFGSIYKAKSTKKDAEVYLRIMPVPTDGSVLSLKEEVEFTRALPKSPYIVQYTGAYRFEESTGEIDCAVMPYYPLGDLAKVLEDWKLDAGERTGLRNRLHEVAAFLRGNEVNLPQFNPHSVFISEEEGQLFPHLIDLSGVTSDNPDYEAQVDQLLGVTGEEAMAHEAAATEKVNEETSNEVPAPENDEVEPSPDLEAPESAEPGDNNSKKWKLLAGVVVTWVLIFTLIGVLHNQRNSTKEITEPQADTVQKVVYPADEFAKEEAAHRDSMAKAAADSIEAIRVADSIAAAKQLFLEQKKAEALKAKEAKEAAAAEPAQPDVKAPETPASVPAETPESTAEPAI
ncbi:MAG: protein kinase [Firmicutes bacterium]|nr:protein kinase [Bacillota bacterium]MCM1400767.1 protein kinase [Bacteroides sp.]MCM1477614.1 protein kinase [Bacteroides sp.]